MAGDAVGLEVVRRLGEQEIFLSFLSRAAHTRLRVGDHVFEFDHAMFDQRQKAELHRSRITAGIGYEPRVPNSCAMQLRQTVYGFT